MDKETLSNYGWIVICVLVLVVMIALATPFGKFISSAVQSTTEGLFASEKGALGKAGIDAGELVFGDSNNGGSGGSSGTEEPGPAEPGTEEPGEGYSQDSTYTRNGATIPIPSIPQAGDTFEEGDYIFRYARGLIGTVDYGSEWSVEVKSTNKTEYGAIRSRIAGKPVNNVVMTFYNCRNLKKAPALPAGVTDLSCTFENCISLEKVPAIPSSVVNVSRAFAGCSSLTDASNISKATKVEDMSYTFWNCTALVNAPDIPSSVKNMDSTFSGCTKLAGTIKIDANPDTYVSCLFWAKGITEITGSTTLKTEILATR